MRFLLEAKLHSVGYQLCMKCREYKIWKHFVTSVKACGFGLPLVFVSFVRIILSPIVPFIMLAHIIYGSVYLQFNPSRMLGT